MKLLLIVLLCILGFFLLLLLAALIRTMLMKPASADYKAAPDAERAKAYADKLSQMIRCETVSRRGVSEPDKFRAFHQVLERLYPNVFRVCEKTDLNGNLLLKWKGKSSAHPILLMSHMDVVEATGKWTHEPFSGDIDQGLVWGRGAGDTKCSVMAFYQAVEELIVSGVTPETDVYLASSCTEETGGDGGPTIVEYLKSKGVRLAMLSDEGGGIIKDPMPGVPGCFAMVGVFEKGMGNLRFSAHGQGGHASAPKKNTPIPQLAKFVAAVDKKSPFKSRMSREVQEMFERLAPYASFPMRLVFSNLWLFKPLLVRVMPKISAQAAAMLRTTIAFTMASGSDGINVIPQEATVSANLRFIPHQGAKESIAVITNEAKKYGLKTEVLDACEPSPSVDISGQAFRLTQEAIANTFPGAGCSPYVVTGATDSRFYTPVCDNCIRFSPVVFGPKQMAGMHGVDETIEVNTLPGAVDYYRYIITHAASLWQGS